MSRRSLLHSRAAPTKELGIQKMLLRQQRSTASEKMVEGETTNQLWVRRSEMFRSEAGAMDPSQFQKNEEAGGVSK